MHEVGTPVPTEEEVLEHALEAVDPKPMTLMDKADAMLIVSDRDIEMSVDLEKQLKQAKKAMEEHIIPFRKVKKDAYDKAKATENKYIQPIVDAIAALKAKRNTRIAENQRIAQKEAEEREVLERAEAQRKLTNTNKAIERLMTKAASSEQTLKELMELLGAPDLSEAEISAIKEQITAVEATQKQTQHNLEAKAARAEEIAAAPVAPAVAAAPVKTVGMKGMVTKTDYEITILDADLLCQDIAAGKIGSGIIKEWDITALKKLAAMGVIPNGVHAKKVITTHTRG